MKNIQNGSNNFGTGGSPVCNDPLTWMENSQYPFHVIHNVSNFCNFSTDFQGVYIVNNALTPALFRWGSEQFHLLVCEAGHPLLTGGISL